MFKLFTNVCALLIVSGIILLVASFYTNISIWYGIEIAKCGGFLFIIAMFMQLLFEKESEKNHSKQQFVE